VSQPAPSAWYDVPADATAAEPQARRADAARTRDRRLPALGYTNREIALACGTSFRTVRNQLSAVYAKLGAANRTEALALGIDPIE
jgi:DNA-binding NarL/FixJ family response regulator